MTMEKMTIEKAKNEIKKYEDRGYVLGGQTEVAEFNEAVGFIEGYESRDAEIEELKNIIKDLGAEDVLREKMK